jgi:hypothetical protein
MGGAGGGRNGAATTRRYNRSTVPRLRWTSELHRSFVRAVDCLGGQDSTFRFPSHASIHGHAFCSCVDAVLISLGDRWCWRQRLLQSSFSSSWTSEDSPLLMSRATFRSVRFFITPYYYKLSTVVPCIIMIGMNQISRQRAGIVT